MVVIVPTLRPEPDVSAIKVGAAVTASTWQNLASLANWLRGRGATLVPACTPMIDIAVGSFGVFRFRVKTRSSAVQRVWVLYLRTVANAVCNVTITAPSGSAPRTASFSGNQSLRSPIVYVENLTSRSSAEQQIEIDIEVETSSSNVCWVDSIACYEQDRPVLQTDSTDYGVDVFSCASGQPIYDGAYNSVGGVYDTLVNADARRVGIFHWTQGDSSGVTSDGSTEDLLALPVPVLVRKLARSATTGSVKWSAYARVSAGTGTITLTHTNAAGTHTDAASVTNTSFAWTATRTVTGFDCDNLSAADGRRSSAWDMLNFTLSASGGNMNIRSISVWQDD